MQPLERGGRRRKGQGWLAHCEAPGPDDEQNLVFGATDSHPLFRLDWGNVFTNVDYFGKTGDGL